MRTATLPLLLCWLLCACDPNRAPPAEARPPTLTALGSMRETLRQGKLAGVVYVDTLTHPNLYGLGPAEYLRGEILVFDGKGYRSRVAGPDSMVVEQTLELRPPFFVYTHQLSWNEYTLPGNVRTLPQLIDYVERLQTGYEAPTAFRLEGTVREATIHVQNLAAGVVPQSPEEAHRGQQNYKLKNRRVDLLGFFSKHHQGVFTHHDSYGHVHLITHERDQLGHLDAVEMEAGMKLFLPR